MTNSAAAPLLNIQGITKSYPNFTLQPVDLVIGPGETVGLIGTNGAGKSTLINTILGITFARGGTLEIFGQPAPRGATEAMREDIGVVFDTCHLPQAFSSADVERLMRLSFRRFDAAEYARYLDLFDVGSFKKMSELSRGMSMKLCLAGALAHRPRLLLLDEATAGLDPMVRDEALEVIARYQAESDCGILMCSHITSDLEKVADRIVCLDNGRMAFSVDREQITDFTGIARCRQADFEVLVAENEAAGTARGARGARGAEAAETSALHYERSPYAINVLVPDRYAFARKHPDIPCDSCSIEDYMRIYLKGETR